MLGSPATGQFNFKFQVEYSSSFGFKKEKSEPAMMVSGLNLPRCATLQTSETPIRSLGGSNRDFRLRLGLGVTQPSRAASQIVIARAIFCALCQWAAPGGAADKICFHEQ